MSFVEVEFAFFLPLVLLAYWLLPRTRIAQNSLLLVAGWLFYASWNWRLLALLVFGALLDFGIGRSLGSRPLADSGARGRRVLALGTSLVWNLGALAYFKYS